MRHGLVDAFIEKLRPLGRVTEGRLREGVADWAAFAAVLERRAEERRDAEREQREWAEVERREIDEENAMRERIQQASESVRERIMGESDRVRGDSGDDDAENGACGGCVVL